MIKTAIFAGSFDPPTNGHVAVLRAALSLCDRLIVGVGAHATKSPLFVVEQRLSLLRDIAAPLADQASVDVEVASFDGLVVDFARQVGATILVRGIRDGTDLDYELGMAGMNAAMSADLTTVFVPAAPETRHISATLVRQIAAMGGDVGPFVPPAVAARLSQISRGAAGARPG